MNSNIWRLIIVAFLILFLFTGMVSANNIDSNNNIMDITTENNQASLLIIITGLVLTLLVGVAHYITSNKENEENTKINENNL